MSALMSWLFHRGRTNESTGEFSRRSRLLPGEETAQQWRVSPSSIKGGIAADDVQARSGPLIVDLEALFERQSALLEGLTPLHEQAALVSFVGTGISDPSRYDDAAGAFNQLRHVAPADESALIQVFRHQLREESKGDDFLFVHFSGDPLSYGLLICPLTGGGLMAGWRLG
jgi:hypothetical protein